MDQIPRLLVVDDEAPQLKALCDLLRGEGYDATGCAGPAQALTQLDAGRFDVMLCDIQMPHFDGIELVRRALQRDPDLAALLMTGQGSIATAVEAMKVGALDYVLKPFRLSVLLPVIDRAITVRRLRVRNRELQERLAQRNAQLEAANRELDAFAGRVAHDLRGPLNHILGFAQLLQVRASGVLDAESAGFVARIIAAGQRNNELIGDLLEFARLGDEPLTRASLALDDVVAAAREAVAPQALGRAVEWKIEPLPVVTGDASLLQQAFVNLLSNALKYTAPRAVAHVQVSAWREAGGGTTVAVHDDGVGFDPALAERLFAPFQRLHRDSEFEGHGIGLANVKRIVARHGGTVAARSAPGEGATFSITLPD